MDWIEGLPESSKGNNSILVVMDRFTRMTHLIPTRKDSTAEDLAGLFLKHIFRCYAQTSEPYVQLNKLRA